MLFLFPFTTVQSCFTVLYRWLLVFCSWPCLQCSWLSKPRLNLRWKFLQTILHPDLYSCLTPSDLPWVPTLLNSLVLSQAQSSGHTLDHPWYFSLSLTTNLVLTLRYPDLCIYVLTHTPGWHLRQSFCGQLVTVLGVLTWDCEGPLDSIPWIVRAKSVSELEVPLQWAL